MRKNQRRSKKMSVMTSRSLHVGAVMIMFFAMVILNLLANSSCTQITKEIGVQHRVLQRVKEDAEREKGRWDDMLRNESIEHMLLKHGLTMRYPREEQIVRMDAAGRILPGQYSVASAHRAAAVRVGSNASRAVPRNRKTSRR